MKTYELTFLVGDEKESKIVKDTLKDVSGSIVSENAWGERTLSYPINKKDKAYFFTWMVKLAKDKVTDFKTKLNFSEHSVRYLLLNTNEEEVVSSDKK